MSAQSPNDRTALSRIDLLLSFIRILIPETSREAINLVSGLNPANHLYLRGRCGLGIDVRNGTGESSQRALRSGVFNSPFLHQAGHQLYRVLIKDNGVVRPE